MSIAGLCSNQRAGDNVTKECVDVAIIGAGLAGLYAARQAAQAGLTVSVLEARERIGGRVFSQRLEDGTVVDLGGQWFGPDHRRVTALAKALNLEVLPVQARGRQVTELDGQIKRRGLPLPLSGLLDVWRIFRRLARLSKPLAVHEPWKHPQAEPLDGLSVSEWLSRNTLSLRTRSFLVHTLESQLCVSGNDVSLLEVAHILKTAGGFAGLARAETSYFAQGAQSLAQGMAAELGGCLRVANQVKEINNAGGLLCMEGESFSVTARHTILALPPQMIEQIAFSGIELPASTHRTVTGRVIKTQVVFDNAWWRERKLSGRAFTPEALVNLFIDGSGVTGRPGILVALSTGPAAARLELLDAQQQRTAILAHIEHAFGRSAKPLQLVSKNWTADPYSLGGYAALRPLGGWTEPQAFVTELGNLHLAGTETATEHRGYMEGALQSGERAVQQVLNALRASQ